MQGCGCKVFRQASASHPLARGWARQAGQRFHVSGTKQPGHSCVTILSLALGAGGDCAAARTIANSAHAASGTGTRAGGQRKPTFSLQGKGWTSRFRPLAISTPPVLVAASPSVSWLGATPAAHTKALLLAAGLDVGHSDQSTGISVALTITSAVPFGTPSILNTWALLTSRYQVSSHQPSGAMPSKTLGQRSE